MRSPFDRSHEACIAARSGRVDASDPLGGEAGDIVWAARLRTGTAEALAAERLAFDHGPDLVAVHIEVSDPGVLLHIVADGVDAALEAQRQAITGRVDRLDHLVELVTREADDVKDRAKILAIQLA